MGASRILVVDDDPGIRELMRTALRLEGLEVSTVEDGPSALAHLRAHPVDVVLLDRMMPGMSGIEVLVQIRRDPELALLPVVLVTAMGDTASAVEGLDHGADDYLVKPFDLQELAARVRSQLRGQRAWIDRMTATVAHRRSVLAAAAGAAGAAAGMVDGAQALCDSLVVEPEMSGIEILAVAGGCVQQLASAGAGGVRLLRMAGATADVRAIEHGLPGGPARFDLPDHVVHAAPVRDGASTLAVVVVTGASPVRGTAADGLLALTIDTAALASGVLADPLRTSQLRADAQARIRTIVDRRAFHPVFQPIVELGTGIVVGLEALSRFDAGIEPAALFAEALRLGVTEELERATLAAAVDAAVASLGPGRWLALNVTPTLLTGSTDLDRVLGPAGGREIVLEISEMERVTDYDALLGAIDDLGATVQISVDDAGAGFASLAHILALAARYVKLDKSWIRGIDVDPAKRALVSGLQSFAAETGASLIAEGIETEAELDGVRHLGIAYGQGMLLGEPGLLPST